MSARRKSKDANELEFLHRILQCMVGSYVIGWLIIIWYTRNIEFLDDTTWRLSAVMVLGLTIWLAFSLSIRATIWWASSTTIVATLRAIAFGMEGSPTAIGVWMLVLSGVSVTILAIISVHVLTGRLPEEDR